MTSEGQRRAVRAATAAGAMRTVGERTMREGWAPAGRITRRTLPDGAVLETIGPRAMPPRFWWNVLADGGGSAVEMDRGHANTEAEAQVAAEQSHAAAGR